MNDVEMLNDAELEEVVREELYGTEPLLTNENYVVLLVNEAEQCADGSYVTAKQGDNYYDEFYEVVNRNTLVSEFRTPSLPEAFYIASANDRALRLHLYLHETDRIPTAKEILN